MDDAPHRVGENEAPRQVTPLPVAPPDARKRLRPWRRARAALRRALPALVFFAVARLTVVAALAAWSWHLGLHPRTILGLEWDSNWYRRIARYGYGTIVPGGPGTDAVYNDLAFFPLYPGLIRALGTVLPIGEVNAALAIAWTGAAAAAWGVYAIGELLYGRRAAFALVALWALLPHAVVLTMAYTESLMTAFASWALYAALTRRWLTAGFLAGLAGLSRPNGIAAAAAVVTAVAAHVWQRHRNGEPADPRAWAAAVLAPAGWLGYVAWVGLRTGNPTGYFAVQRDWGSWFDFGHYTVSKIKHLITGHDTLVVYLAAGIALGAVLLYLLAILGRQPLPLLVYATVLIVMALGGAHYFTSKPRLLLPAFPLLLPVALSLSRARPGTVAVLLTALAGFSFIYGPYLLTVAKYAP